MSWWAMWERACEAREGGRLLLAYVVLCVSVPLICRLSPGVSSRCDRRGSIATISYLGIVDTSVGEIYPCPLLILLLPIHLRDP